MAIVQFRCDDKLKNDATKIYEEIGLDLSSALRLFLVKSISVHGLPFNPNNQTNEIKEKKTVDYEELSLFQDFELPDNYQKF